MQESNRDWVPTEERIQIYAEKKGWGGSLPLFNDIDVWQASFTNLRAEGLSLAETMQKCYDEFCARREEIGRSVAAQFHAKTCAKSDYAAEMHCRNWL